MCGWREREADVGNQDAQASLLPAVATVEGTPIHGMPVAFAGCRRNEGLGRSVALAVGLVPLQSLPPATTRCPLEERGGERRQRAPKRPHSSQEPSNKRLPLRSRTRPSLGPETRARQSPLKPRRESVGGRGAVGSVSRSGKPAQAGGTGTGVETNGRKRGSPRVTAFRGNSTRSCVTRQKRKVVMATVPARKRESRRGVRTSCSVAEVGRQHPGLE